MRVARHAEDEPACDVCFNDVRFDDGRFNAEALWSNSADQAQVHVGVFQSDLERAA